MSPSYNVHLFHPDWTLIGVSCFLSLQVSAQPPALPDANFNALDYRLKFIFTLGLIKLKFTNTLSC
jgi:hypothetical protein